MHEAPQYWAVSHVTHWLLMHCLFEPQSPFVMHSTQVPLGLQRRPEEKQFSHVAPQCRSLLQLVHVPPLHHLPLPQSASTEQSLQKPFSQP